MIILSILIPAFNYKKGLIKILESLRICEKKYLEKIEIIIGDDSEVRLLNKKELKFYQSYFCNLKYKFNKSKKGIGFNWNQLIEMSNGKFYWLFHHDEEIYNSSKTIRNILKSLNNEHQVLLLKIIKRNTISILRNKINLYKFHTAPNYYTNFFIRKKELILLLNVIGPPSAFVISKKIKLKYNTKLKWLIDIEFYSKLFNLLTVNQIKKIELNSGFIISNQNNPTSITKDLKKNKRTSRILIKKEKNILLNKFLFKGLLYRYFLWIVYKFHYIINTIYINIYLLKKEKK